MQTTEILTAVLLLVGLGFQVLATAGVLFMPGPLKKLHYVGAASALGAPPLAVAVALHEPQFAVQALLVAAVVVISGPVLTHATAHALHHGPEGATSK